MKPDLQDVLDAVNEVLNEYKLGDPLTELPKGARVDPMRCVIAQALGGLCTSTCLWLHGEVVVQLPRVLTSFIRLFDLGEYPELEIPRPRPIGG